MKIEMGTQIYVQDFIVKFYENALGRSQVVTYRHIVMKLMIYDFVF